MPARAEVSRRRTRLATDHRSFCFQGWQAQSGSAREALGPCLLPLVVWRQGLGRLVAASQRDAAPAGM